MEKSFGKEYRGLNRNFQSVDAMKAFLLEQIRDPIWEEEIEKAKKIEEKLYEKEDQLYESKFCPILETHYS